MRGHCVQLVSVPQWSPPLNGGSTRLVTPATVVLRRAAMEPAVERREHHAGDRAAAIEATLPQWSPPLKGGSTGRGSPAQRRLQPPQWSPPLKGGSTRDVAAGGAVALSAAMEPAVERREHLTATVDRLAVAAMEPAVERREHAASAAARSVRAAMEPAVERREHAGRRTLAAHPSRAAMEPAVERREHSARHCRTWSPDISCRNGARR